MKLFQAASQFLILYIGIDESVPGPVCRLTTDACFPRGQGWVGLGQPLGCASRKADGPEELLTDPFKNLGAQVKKEQTFLIWCECFIPSLLYHSVMYKNHMFHHILIFSQFFPIETPPNVGVFYLFLASSPTRLFFSPCYIIWGFNVNP